MWLRLFNIILFCWSKDITNDNLLQSKNWCGNFVEHQVFQYQTEIRRLRKLYVLSVDQSTLQSILSDCLDTVSKDIAWKRL